jgi:hypothetical protein
MGFISTDVIFSGHAISACSLVKKALSRGPLKRAGFFIHTVVETKESLRTFMPSAASEFSFASFSLSLQRK